MNHLLSIGAWLRTFCSLGILALISCFTCFSCMHFAWNNVWIIACWLPLVIKDTILSLARGRIVSWTTGRFFVVNDFGCHSNDGILIALIKTKSTLLCSCTHQIIAPFSELLFMSQSLNYMLVYIWARRNPDVRMNFMGFVNFDAPYLPWFLMGFSLFLHNSIPIHEVIGAAVGHLYYFFDDVYPVVSRTGKRYLRAPMWLYVVV